MWQYSGAHRTLYWAYVVDAKALPQLGTFQLHVKARLAESVTWHDRLYLLRVAYSLGQWCGNNGKILIEILCGCIKK